MIMWINEGVMLKVLFDFSETIWNNL
jgi:hypothetical protein